MQAGTALVVLARVACVHRGASRLLFDGGEARDMIETSFSPSIAHDRHQAKLFDGSLTVKLRPLQQKSCNFR